MQAFEFIRNLLCWLSKYLHGRR